MALSEPSADDPAAYRPGPLAGSMLGRWVRAAPFIVLAAIGVMLATFARPHSAAAVWAAAAVLAGIVLAVAAVPWRRVPADWHAAPVTAVYAISALLTYAAPRSDNEFVYLTALPVIWAVLFHTRRVLLAVLVLLALTLFLPQVLRASEHPTHWGNTTMAFALSVFGGLAGYYLISRSRTATAEAQAATERARADHDLLTAYLDNAGALVMVLDPAGRVTLFNSYAEEVTGYSAGQVSIELMWRMSGRPRAAQEIFAQILAGGPPVRVETEPLTRSGKRLRVAWNVTGKTDQRGRVTDVIAFGLDVTEQRAAERLFANVLAAARDQMIAATDITGTFIAFNAGAERLLGYRADEMIGIRQAEDIHLPEELAALATAAGFPSFREMLLSPPPEDLEVAGDWTLVRKDGSRFPARMSVTTMRDDGNAVGYVMVAYDITAELKAKTATEQALERERAAADRLRELDQVKNDFVASVSHDLRTPLTSIIGNVSLLLDGQAGELGPTPRRLLAVVDRNAQRLDALVGNLLMLSRIESGTLRMHPRAVSVREIINGALEALAAQRNPDVSLDVEVPSEPVLVHGDPDQLERVTTNLISNALKFTPPGGRVAVRLEPDRDQVRLVVSDTGIGIPEDELPHVFDRFFRSSRAANQQRSGIGLGLTIVKSIVEQHGGTIQADADPGGGTTMTVTLPRLAASADAPEREPA